MVKQNLKGIKKQVSLLYFWYATQTEATAFKASLETQTGLIRVLMNFNSWAKFIRLGEGKISSSEHEFWEIYNTNTPI